MNYLIQDFETRSEANLPKVELDNYVKHPSTRAMMLSWHVNQEPVNLWMIDSEEMPKELRLAMLDPAIKKVAHEASFEKAIWRDVMPRQGYKFEINDADWIDTAVLARSLSMPGKLEDLCPVIGIESDKAKMREGKALIKLFCMPKVVRKKRKLEEHEAFFGEDPVLPSFNGPDTHPEKWETFKEYCRRDTIAETELLYMMEPFLLTGEELEGYLLDQEINSRGIPTDIEFARKALEMGNRYQDEQTTVLTALTGLENVNSPAQMLAWVKERKYPYDSLLRKLVEGFLELTKPGGDAEDKATPELRRALQLRLECGKSSHSKFETLLLTVSATQRLLRQFMFLGAARTGRWSGRGFQFQNQPRPIIKNVEEACELIRAGDYHAMKAKYPGGQDANGKELPNVIDAVVSCIRASFVASKGKTFVVSDLNAIENRVLGYVCNEPEIQNVFTKKLDPYLDFGARLFKIPYEKLYADYQGYKKALKEKREPTDEQNLAADIRQLSKPAVLGAGFGLGAGKEVTDEAGNKHLTGLRGYSSNMGVAMTQAEADKAIKIFRTAYPGVPKFWKEIERACFAAIVTGDVTRVGVVTVSRFVRKNGEVVLRIKLPSGRSLTYINARIETRTLKNKKNVLQEDGSWEEEDNFYDTETIAYDGIGHGVAAVEGVRGWGKVYTYGGKITENIVQAIARDILLFGMLLARKIMDIILHVHDEIGAEVEKARGKEMMEKLVEIMSTTPPWAPGLLLGAEGYVSDYYKKG